MIERFVVFVPVCFSLLAPCRGASTSPCSGRLSGVERSLPPEKRDEVKGRSAPWTCGWELVAGKGEPVVECLLCFVLVFVVF